MMGAKRFCVIACHVLWRELCHHAALSRNVFLFRFLKQGLHATPDRLRAELQAEIDRVEGEFDAVLVGYGLCSNGLAGIAARKHPLVVMRGHDCLTFFLGSHRRYKEYFDAHPGTYWYTVGWMETSCRPPGRERYERTRRAYVEKYGEDNVEYLMQMEQGWLKQYSNAAFVDTGVGDVEACRNYTRECAQWLGWTCDELKGDPALLTNWFDGCWNPDDFLVVEPGQRIAASFDDRILRAEPVENSDTL